MSKLEKLIEELNIADDTLTLDGFDDAAMGIVDRTGSITSFVYDTEKIIKILEKGGMSNDEAVEFFEFNVFGAYGGASSPYFFLGTKPKVKKKTVKKKKNRGGKK